MPLMPLYSPKHGICFIAVMEATVFWIAFLHVCAFFNWIPNYPWWITYCCRINLYGKNFIWTDKLDDLSTDEGFQQLNYLHVKHEIGW